MKHQLRLQPDNNYLRITLFGDDICSFVKINVDTHVMIQ